VNFLLDTHVWFWMLTEPKRIKPAVQKAVLNPENELWLSPISLWEVYILNDKQRITLNAPFSAWCGRMLAELPVREAALTNEVVAAIPEIRILHPDPADVFLAATARAYNLTLITSDAKLLAGKGFTPLKN
jgi:PIN domain nuclease of toxin-antitoxin system